MISIRNDIYQMLDRMKMEGESFSDVILRLIDSARKDPLRHFGIGNDDPEHINELFEEGMDLARKANRHRWGKHQAGREDEVSGQ